MGRSSFLTRVRGATHGLKARISASAEIWDNVGPDGSEPEVEDVSDWLELPRDFRAPDDNETAYRPSTDFELEGSDHDLDDAAWSMYEQQPR